VALDTELHREVAMKQILDQQADDPVSRQRFLLEAEVTGGLEHPGIVPVYGLGTYADGRPFYAMRFIKGDSLK
jgi:serine/threonine protein kinase